jgi:hypothetical protein
MIIIYYHRSNLREGKSVVPLRGVLIGCVRSSYLAVGVPMRTLLTSDRMAGRWVWKISAPCALPVGLLKVISLEFAIQGRDTDLERSCGGLAVAGIGMQGLQNGGALDIRQRGVDG